MKKREKNRTEMKHLSTRIASAIIALAIILTCVPQMTAQAAGIFEPQRSEQQPFIASDCYTPNPVRNVKVTKKNSRSITVKFKKPAPSGHYAVKGANVYEVRAYKGGGVVKKAFAPGTATSVTINGLKPNTKYTIKVYSASCMSSVPSYGKAVSVSAKTKAEKKTHVHSYKKTYRYQPKYKQMNVSTGSGAVIDYEYKAYKASKGKWTLEEWYMHTNGNVRYLPVTTEGCGARQIAIQSGYEFNEDCKNTVTICGAEYCMHSYELAILPEYNAYKTEWASISENEFPQKAGMNYSYDKYKVQVGVEKKAKKVCSCGAVK